MFFKGFTKTTAVAAKKIVCSNVQKKNLRKEYFHHSSLVRRFGGFSSIKIPEFPIYKIVLTGGPCGGKSSALPHLRSIVEQHGYKVFTVPEAATIIFSNGAEWDTLSDAARFSSVSATMKMQIALEDAFSSIAKHHARPAVILCDRGVLDNEAYVPRSSFWQMILHDNEWNLPLLRERRYDLVLHMTTTAIGAEHAYNRSNNVARRETAEQAAELDRRILSGYLGHPRVSILDNSTDFNTKVQRAANYILNMLRIDTSRVFQKRYLIEYKNQKLHEQQKLKMREALFPTHNDHFYAFQHPLKQRYADVTLEKNFLVAVQQSSQVLPYVARIGEFGAYQYYYRPENSPKDIPISVGDYLSLMEAVSDKKRVPISKRLRYFIHNNYYYNYCDFNHGELQFLSVTLDHFNSQKGWQLPDFLTKNDQVELHEVPLESFAPRGVYNDYTIATTLAQKQ